MNKQITKGDTVKLKTGVTGKVIRSKVSNKSKLPYLYVLDVDGEEVVIVPIDVKEVL